MIKLIATDVDGTLVKDASPELYPEIIEIVLGILALPFMACSFLLALLTFLDKKSKRK